MCPRNSCASRQCVTSRGIRDHGSCQGPCSVLRSLFHVGARAAPTPANPSRTFTEYMAKLEKNRAQRRQEKEAEHTTQAELLDDPSRKDHCRSHRCGDRCIRCLRLLAQTGASRCGTEAGRAGAGHTAPAAAGKAAPASGATRRPEREARKQGRQGRVPAPRRRRATRSRFTTPGRSRTEPSSTAR